MTEFDFLLSDRITKIKSMNDVHNLEDCAYVSFSGGKDSTVLSALVDMAIPNNNIPRVYINTGIDYRAVVSFVEDCRAHDSRVVIIRPEKDILRMLRERGYPFKSKEHSQKVALFQRSGKTKTIRDYLGEGEKKTFLCPEKLRYNFTPSFPLKVSDSCCHELKKKPAEKWMHENGRPVTITGIRHDEGGLRKSVAGCAVFSDDSCHELKKFHPLLPCPSWWVDEFVARFGVKLCELYSAPYNFKRTGCKGCPFALDLQAQLDTMARLMPSEKKQCEMIWAPVYAEYRRIGYRLDGFAGGLFS